MFPGPIFSASRLAFAYPRSPGAAVQDVSLDAFAGRLFAIVGPNGSGKSTLLKLLLGALTPASGGVWFAGRPVGAWDRRQMARLVGAVPQTEETAFPWTVRDLVEMGRYPHLGPWRPARGEDDDAVSTALARCGADGLADRRVSTLSVGERQRARIARALAQRPTALVLDEPTAALDVRHEMMIFELLAELAHDDGVAVILVTHNLNLAARYADDVLLLSGGRAVAAGPPAQVFEREILESVYRWPLAVSAHPGPGPDAGAPQVIPLSTARPSHARAQQERECT